LPWTNELSVDDMCLNCTLNSFRRFLFRFHTRCKLFHSRTKKYQFLRMFLCFCRLIVGVRWSNCMKCTHLFNMSKIFAPKCNAI
jgi:hypothetical protein